MKKETKNLVIGILVGFLTGLVGDYVFEIRADVISWVLSNPVLSLIFVGSAIGLGYVATR